MFDVFGMGKSSERKAEELEAKLELESGKAEGREKIVKLKDEIRDAKGRGKESRGGIPGLGIAASFGKNVLSGVELLGQYGDPNFMGDDEKEEKRKKNKKDGGDGRSKGEGVDPFGFGPVDLK